MRRRARSAPRAARAGHTPFRVGSDLCGPVRRKPKEMRVPVGISYRFLALVAFFLLARPASAAPFVIGDADFVSGVYELRYYTGSNQLVLNGTATPLGSAPLGALFLTNESNAGSPAWQTGGTDPGFAYLQAPIALGTRAAATMGFDLSAVTGQIARVELLTQQYLFQFPPWNDEAMNDSIFADVATPSAFGAGPYAQIYSFTSNNPAGTGPHAIGTGAVLDITSLLPGAWLASPALLELRFGYALANADIPDKHLQLFRDGLASFPADDGFLLRITLVPEPGTAALAALGALLLAARSSSRRARALRS